MKPAWDSLGSEFADSTSVVIGDADCTASGSELCSDFEVRGYPTIKYFTADSGEKGTDYSGGRDAASLKKFVEDTLLVKCDVNDTKDCTEKEAKYIEKMKAKSADDIAKQLERLVKMKKSSMKAELKQWLNQRHAILTQLA
jgi:protein disulfide-isomerase A6